MPFIPLAHSTSYSTTMHETPCLLMVGRQTPVPHTGPTVDKRVYPVYSYKLIDRCRQAVRRLHSRCSNKDNKSIQAALEHRRIRPQGISVVRTIGGMLPTITDSVSIETISRDEVSVNHIVHGKRHRCQTSTCWETYFGVNPCHRLPLTITIPYKPVWKCMKLTVN